MSSKYESNGQKLRRGDHPWTKTHPIFGSSDYLYTSIDICNTKMCIHYSASDNPLRQKKGPLGVERPHVAIAV
jgi:hypothetical protein